MRAGRLRVRGRTRAARLGGVEGVVGGRAAMRGGRAGGRPSVVVRRGAGQNAGQMGRAVVGDSGYEDSDYLGEGTDYLGEGTDYLGEGTDYFEFDGSRVESNVGLGEFINQAVNLDDDTGMRTNNFNFRGHFGMRNDAGGVAAGMSRGVVGQSDDVGLSSMYGGNDWGNIARVDSRMPSLWHM
jgi:hypothetical protein